MTEDYINPKQREKQLINRSKRRASWLTRIWKISKTGNYFLNVDDTNIVIYREKKSQNYKVKIGETFGRKKFDSLTKAKIAAFNGHEYPKGKGRMVNSAKPSVFYSITLLQY